MIDKSQGENHESWTLELTHSLKFETTLHLEGRARSNASWMIYIATHSLHGR